MSNISMVNQNNFETEVLNSDLPVVVDFYADWCGPCRMMTPVLESLSEKMKGKVKIAKLNTDDNQALAVKYDISGIPCLVIFKNGQEVNRLIGYQQESQIINSLNSII